MSSRAERTGFNSGISEKPEIMALNLLWICSFGHTARMYLTAMSQMVLVFEQKIKRCSKVSVPCKQRKQMGEGEILAW